MSKKKKKQQRKQQNQTSVSVETSAETTDPRRDCVFVTPRGLVTVRVRVKPGARQSQLLHITEGELEMQIDAPAREGEANAGVCEFMAQVLGVSKSSVGLVSGHKSRNKVLSVDGMEAENVQSRIHEQLKQE